MLSRPGVKRFAGPLLPLIVLASRSNSMLRNILAVIGGYVVGKKVLGWYQEYSVLKREQQRREKRAEREV